MDCRTPFQAGLLAQGVAGEVVTTTHKLGYKKFTAERHSSQCFPPGCSKVVAMRLRSADGTVVILPANAFSPMRSVKIYRGDSIEFDIKFIALGKWFGQLTGHAER